MDFNFKFINELLSDAGQGLLRLLSLFSKVLFVVAIILCLWLAIENLKQESDCKEWGGQIYKNVCYKGEVLK